MKVLFVTNNYPPFHTGGYEELCEEVANGLEARGHSVSILTSNIGKELVSYSKVPVHRKLIPEVHGPPILVSINTILGLRSRLAKNIRVVKETLEIDKPDIIMVWGMWNIAKSVAAYLEKFSGVPVVFFFADQWPLLPNSIILHWHSQSDRKPMIIPKKIIGRLIDNIGYFRDYDNEKIDFLRSICISQSVKNNLIEGGVLTEAASVIHSGIVENDFKPSLRNINPEGGLSLLFAGRISPEKGVLTTLETMKHLLDEHVDAKLDIIGGGSSSYINDLKKITLSLGIHPFVKFKDRVPREKMPEVYSSYDILLVPSITPDSLPRVIFEGMCSGCIVAATNVGGIPEIIEDGVNGFLFNPEDAYTLARIIQNLAGNQELLDSIRSNAIETIHTEFQFSRFLEEIEDYLRHLVKS